MATTLTSTGSLSSDAVDFYIRAKMLKHGESKYLTRAALEHNSQPKGEGTDIKFVRVPRIVLAGTLTEGTTPTADTFDIETVTATCVQYGQRITVSDVVDLTLKHPLARAAMDELAESAARKDDQLLQDVIGAATTVIYGGGAASRSAMTATDYLTTEDIRQAVATLQVPSDGVDGSAPPYPDGNFLGLFHAKHELDLMSDTDFRNYSYRLDGEALRTGVFNKWAGVTFKRMVFGPQFTLETITGGAAADAGSGTTYDNTAVIKWGLVQKHLKRGFAEGIDDNNTHTMGANEDLEITTGTSTDYEYDVYADSAADGSGTRKLFAADQSAATAVDVTSLPTGATIPSAPASGVTVYRSYILAMNSAAVVDLANLQTFLVKGASKSDPLNQRTEMGTKWFDVGVINNDAHLIVLEAPSRY